MEVEGLEVVDLEVDLVMAVEMASVLAAMVLVLVAMALVLAAMALVLVLVLVVMVLVRLNQKILLVLQRNHSKRCWPSKRNVLPKNVPPKKNRKRPLTVMMLQLVMRLQLHHLRVAHRRLLRRLARRRRRI